MARVVSVTFETEAHGQAGHFTIPKRVADFLGIRDDGAVELRVLCEGFKLELATSLRSGLEVYPRTGDATTAGLERIPARAALTVTVSHPRDDVDAVERRKWDRTSFVDALAEVGIVRDVADKILGDCLAWATDRGVTARWGDARSGSILFSLADDRIASRHGRKQRMFALWTTGRIELQFDVMAPPFGTKLRRAEIQDRLAVEIGASVDRVVGFPGFPMDLIADKAARLRFLAIQDWILSETRDGLVAESGDRKPATWQRTDLESALSEYERACVESDMKPLSVHSYVGYATRFVRWLYGDYVPRGGSANDSPVTAAHTLRELIAETKPYEASLRAAGREESAIATYVRHAMFFLRWLSGDFEPGGRLQG